MKYQKWHHYTFMSLCLIILFLCLIMVLFVNLLNEVNEKIKSSLKDVSYVNFQVCNRIMVPIDKKIIVNVFIVTGTLKLTKFSK